MPTLVVRHVETSDPPQFQVVRLKDGKTTPPVAIGSPANTPVKDLPNSNLSALFGAGQGRDFYGEAYRLGLEEKLDLRIASNGPGVLAWPWEALADPQQAGALAHHCRIERQLDRGHDPLPLPEGLPRDGVSIFDTYSIMRVRTKWSTYGLQLKGSEAVRTHSAILMHRERVIGFS